MFEPLKRSNPYIIAEVGQNHQGDKNIALDYIDEFSKLGASSIKFQMRDIDSLFDVSSINKPYFSENSFADTYGEHRKKLELDKTDFIKISQRCKKNKIDFMCTPFEEKSLETLLGIGIDVIKISSFDVGNLPFLEIIAEQKKPIVMSCGGVNDDQIQASVDTILSKTSNLALLHCVSEYPCEYNRLGLGKISSLIKKYPTISIGSSDHFNGILSGPVAYMLGARIFEKHVTFNRAWKGTDHSFALEPTGFKKFTRDIERTPKMIPEKNDGSLGEENVFKKLGKSLIFNKNLEKGSVISKKDLSSKIFDINHIHVRNSNNIIGKKLNIDVSEKQIVKFDYFD